MKKIIKLILKILLPIFLVVITVSFIIENTTIKTISNDIITKKISGYMLDEVINEVNDDTFYEIADKIENSKYMEDITQKYLDILTGKSKKIDIKEEINLIMENDLGDTISEELKHKIVDYVNKKSTYLENALEIGTEENTKEILNVYSIFTSFSLRIVFFMLILLDIIVLIILEKKDVFKTLQKSSIITAVLSIIIFIILKILSKYIKQRLSGGWIDNINLNLMIVFIIVEIIIGFILFVVRKVLDRKANNSKELE